MAAARVLNSYIPGNERIMFRKRGEMKQAGIYRQGKEQAWSKEPCKIREGDFPRKMEGLRWQ